MKKLTNRVKLLLGLAGALIVVAAGLVLTNPPANALFGATAVVITPSNSTMAFGATQGLSVNSVYNCNWFTSNAAVVSFVGDTTEVKNVTVKGNAGGTVTIEARCGLVNLNHVSTTVTVVSPVTITPANPTLDKLGYVTLTAQGPAGTSCTWTSSASSVQIMNSTPTSAAVYGYAPASGTITATCNVGSASTLVSYVFKTLAITPTRPEVCPGDSVQLTAQKAGVALSCTWSSSDSSHVSLSSSTATTTMAKGVNSGGTQVTATCNGETASVDVTVLTGTSCSTSKIR